MPNRNIQDANAYRYAYQGQEKDPETGKEAFQLRLWDGRIGRWLTTDPYGQYHSPYLGMGNNPINGIDPDGGYEGRWSAFWGWVAGGFKGSIVDLRGNGNTGDRSFAIQTISKGTDGNLFTLHRNYGGSSYSRGYDAKWGRSNGYGAKIEQGYSNGNFSINNTISFIDYDRFDKAKNGYLDAGVNFNVASTSIDVNYGSTSLKGKGKIGALDAHLKWGPLINNNGRTGWIGSIGAGASVVEGEGQITFIMNLGIVKLNPTIIYGGSAITINGGGSVGIYHDNKTKMIHLMGIEHGGFGFGQKVGVNCGIGLGSFFK